MKITIDLKDLMAELQQVFPEINGDKLKAAMFDLMMKIEEGTIGEVVAPPAREADDTETVPQRSSILGEPTGWGDVGKPVKVKNDSAFDFEDAPTDPNAPLPKPPPPPGGKRGKLSREEKAAQRREASQFEGLTDREIAEKLTEQSESKQKKNNGQFTQLGDTSPGGGEDFVVG